MEDKLFELMAQAEDLQKHAAKLQNEAQKVFSALPLAVEQAGQKIRSMGLQMAFILLAFSCVTGGIVFAVLQWYTASLLKDCDALRTEILNLKATIQVEEATLAEMKSKTWGLRLLEDKNGRFIVLPKDTRIDTEKKWTLDKDTAIRLVK